MPHEALRSVGDRREILSWTSGGLQFGAAIVDLDEVVDCRSYFPINRLGPPICQGFSSTRGQVVHVLSARYLWRCLALGPLTAEGAGSAAKMIVFTAGGVRWGVLAQGMGRVLDLRQCDQQPWRGSQKLDVTTLSVEGDNVLWLPLRELVERYEELV